MHVLVMLLAGQFHLKCMFISESLLLECVVSSAMLLSSETESRYKEVNDAEPHNMFLPLNSRLRYERDKF